jgi:acyl-coenzyme A synthetase/AMP-(fatty) acid ligase
MRLIAVSTTYAVTGDTVAWPTNLGWMMGPWLIFQVLNFHLLFHLLVVIIIIPIIVIIIIITIIIILTTTTHLFIIIIIISSKTSSSLSCIYQLINGASLSLFYGNPASKQFCKFIEHSKGDDTE